jgi:pectate disaccharide-lyase
MLLLWPVCLHGATFYISPTGSDTNSGALDSPFYNIAKAAPLAIPGDTIYLRGGTFSYSTTILITNAGTPASLIKLWAYPNEHPVLDFSTMADDDANRGIRLTTNSTSGVGGSYWHIRGLEIYRAGDNGMKIEGSGNIIENCSFHHNRDSGLQMGLGDSDADIATRVFSNQIINCDSYLNYDPRHGGGNADGFCCKLHPGPGNVFRGCRSWENSDDGWDLYKNNYDVTLEDCWTWHNGDPASFNTNAAGNAEGFKLGGDSNFTGPRSLRRCIAFNNRYGSSSDGKAYHQNDHHGQILLYNCLSFSNNYNYTLNNDVTVNNYVENCVTIGGDTKSFTFSSNVITISNSWNIAGIIANAADYFILTEAAAKAPRQADGSLPNNGFARLVAGSDLIDKGVNVGLPYNGSKPDLGPFEWTPQTNIVALSTSLTETGLNVLVTGLTGHGSIILQSSPDLVSWTPFLTNPPAWGSAQYVDPAATNYTQRFYKVQEK